MSDKETKDYIAFLESAVCEDAEVIDVPEVYKGLASPVRDWDGNSQFPTISAEEDLTDVVGKILKKSADDNGVDDPDRDEGGPNGSIAESNLAADAKDEFMGEPTEEEEDEEECSECDKKIEEIYKELGISPLSLLEEDDGEEDDDDDDDELPEGTPEEVEDSEDDEETEKISEGFTKSEKKVLETLIHEMGLAEEEDADFSDEPAEEEDAEEEAEEIDFVDEEE